MTTMLKNSPQFLTVISRIADERLRQKHLLALGKIMCDCADPEVEHDRKLRVQVEEVGEVAEAIDILERGSRMAFEELRAELTQVAAVTVAWLEAMELESPSTNTFPSAIGKPRKRSTARSRRPVAGPTGKVLAGQATNPDEHHQNET